MTGLNTQFTNTFKGGDSITIGGQTLTISGIVNDTSLTTTTAITNANSGVTYSLVGGDRFVVNGNGRVGIGTTNPAYTLDLTGGTMCVGAAFVVTG
ncbi:MAG: mechanosensitive ion channel domain-containing protein [bacterium]